jgi:hypothetical protein
MPSRHCLSKVSPEISSTIDFEMTITNNLFVLRVCKELYEEGKRRER